MVVGLNIMVGFTNLSKGINDTTLLWYIIPEKNSSSLAFFFEESYINKCEFHLCY